MDRRQLRVFLVLLVGITVVWGGFVLTMERLGLGTLASVLGVVISATLLVRSLVRIFADPVRGRIYRWRTLRRMERVVKAHAAGRRGAEPDPYPSSLVMHVRDAHSTIWARTGSNLWIPVAVGEGGLLPPGPMRVDPGEQGLGWNTLSLRAGPLHPVEYIAEETP